MIKNRVGETNIANNGQVMTIIEYRNCNDIDIEFEDGTVVKHKFYKHFKRGDIKNSNLSNTRIKNRTGEINIAKNGQTITIIGYRRNDDIDVQFEDGTIIKNKSYDNFKKGKMYNQFKLGNIDNPNTSLRLKNRTGEKSVTTNEQTMTIIKYRNNQDIDVQFEDGTIVKHKQYISFKKGNIKNPNYKKKVS